jgi:hypothetical protein
VAHARLRKTLVEERTQWLQRIRATLFHHGVPVADVPERLLSQQGRAFLERVELPEAARERIVVALTRSKRSRLSWCRSSKRCAASPAASPAAKR